MAGFLCYVTSKHGKDESYELDITQPQYGGTTLTTNSCVKNKNMEGNIRMMNNWIGCDFTRGSLMETQSATPTPKLLVYPHGYFVPLLKGRQV